MSHMQTLVSQYAPDLVKLIALLMKAQDSHTEPVFFSYEKQQHIIIRIKHYLEV